MTDIPGGTPPFGSFPGFPGFSQQDMMEKMWDLMRLNPFAAAAIPGGAQGMGPSLSMMSDMLAPLASIEEIDKRVTDMRAVEQWLKLNLNMLQSAIQALEVQRATLSTLRAFGAFAQQSMTQPAPEAPPRHVPQPAASAPEASEAGESAASPAFDASGWWNLLQAQFNQIAQFAMAQPPDTTATGASEAGAGIEPSDLEPDDAPEPDAQGTAQAKSDDAPRAAAKRAASTKRAGASSAKKTSSTSE